MTKKVTETLRDDKGKIRGTLVRDLQKAAPITQQKAVSIYARSATPGYDPADY